jgi:hypothetical protein
LEEVQVVAWVAYSWEAAVVCWQQQVRHCVVVVVVVVVVTGSGMHSHCVLRPQYVGGWGVGW